MFKRLKQFADETAKWVYYGKPTRSPEEMMEIWNICNDCEHIGPHALPEYKQCTGCGCGLHPTAKLLNKIAWATTRCPLTEDPKWVESVEMEEETKKDEA